MNQGLIKLIITITESEENIRNTSISCIHNPQPPHNMVLTINITFNC